ncbi:tannase/feruloyl esterase family alpha/beta hydrolase [Paraburkholderia silviterrae]
MLFNGSYWRNPVRGIPTVEATSAQFPLLTPLQRGIAYTASNGGREACLAAQNLPGDYDAIIAGDEGMNIATQVTAMLRTASLAGSAAMPSAAQWTAAYNATAAQCGNANGVILNPAACALDPATLLCGASGAPTATCLSTAQLQIVRDQFAPLSTSNGQLPFVGYNWTDFGSQFAIDLRNHGSTREEARRSLYIATMGQEGNTPEWIVLDIIDPRLRAAYETPASRKIDPDEADEAVFRECQVALTGAGVRK